MDLCRPHNGLPASRIARAWLASLVVISLLAGAIACAPQPAAARRPVSRASAPADISPATRFQAVVAGSVSMADRFAGPVTTVFILAQNSTDQPQLLTSTQTVLYGDRGQQLGTKSWGSRPIILAPGGQILLANAFEGVSQWSGIDISVSNADIPPGRAAYDGLSMVESSLTTDSKGVTVRGVARNVGTQTALDAAAIVVGYGNRGSIVAWGCSYLVQSPLPPGASRQFEATELRGDPSRIVAHKIFLYAQQGDL